MFADAEASLGGDLGLTPLDLGVIELHHLPAVGADQMIMVATLVELEHRAVTFEVMTHQHSSLLELGQHTVDGGQTHVDALRQKGTVDVLGRKVTRLAALEQGEDAQARLGRLETDALEVVCRGGHGARALGTGGAENGLRYHNAATPEPLIGIHMRCIPLSLLFVCLMLSACGVKLPGVDDLPGLRPYRINVQQGNALTQEMVAKLKPGMTRSQVRFVLGTPMVQDPFHAQRWDYVYFFTEGHKPTRSRRLTVVFEDDKLLRLEGDVVGRPGGANDADPVSPATVDAPPPTAAPGGVPAGSSGAQP